MQRDRAILTHRTRCALLSAAGPQIEFVLNAEAGVLEQQALLLCESVRRFGGDLSSSLITVVSPRKSRRPCAATLAQLDRLQVDYLPLEIQSACPEYGPSFKVHAVAHVARRAGPAIVVQIDSDSLFVRAPHLLTNIDAAAARPVDVKGMCTTGSGDEFDEHWRTLCAIADVDYERVPILQTTVDRLRVRASYNGGLIAARRAGGVFERTEEFFERFVAADQRPWRRDGFVVRSGTELVSTAGSAYWGLSQAAFSLAAIACGNSVDLFPSTYNFPLHFLETTAVPMPLVHIHYHWLASDNHEGPSALLDGRLGLPEDVREWLRSRLPLNAGKAWRK